MIVPEHIRAAAAADAPIAPAVPATHAGAGEGGAVALSPATPPAAVDYQAEARDVCEFAASLFLPLYPSLEPIYTPDVRSRIASSAAPLMAKYSLSLGVLGPELGFAIVIVPLIVPTIAAIKHDNAQRKAQAQQTEKDATPGERAAQPRPIAPGAGAGRPGAAAKPDAGALGPFAHGLEKSAG